MVRIACAFYASATTLAAAGIGLYNPTTGSNILKGVTGLGLLEPAIQAALTPHRPFYEKNNKNIQYDEPSPLLGGLSPEQLAISTWWFPVPLSLADAVLACTQNKNSAPTECHTNTLIGSKGSAVNKGTPEITNSITDGHSKIVGVILHENLLNTPQDRLSYPARVIALQDIKTNKINIIVFGFSGDDVKGGLHALLIDMHPRIKELENFINTIKEKYGSDSINQIIGISMGSIPVSVVSFKQKIPALFIDPRITEEMAKQFVQPEQMNNFKEHIKNNTTAIIAMANTWNTASSPTLFPLATFTVNDPRSDQGVYNPKGFQNTLPFLIHTQEPIIFESSPGKFPPEIFFTTRKLTSHESACSLTGIEEGLNGMDKQTIPTTTKEMLQATGNTVPAFLLGMGQLIAMTLGIAARAEKS